MTAWVDGASGWSALDRCTTNRRPISHSNEVRPGIAGIPGSSKPTSHSPMKRSSSRASRMSSAMPAPSCSTSDSRAPADSSGYVGYEAAPGLDPSLRLADRGPDDPLLVWSGIGGPPTEAPPLADEVPPPVTWTADWTPDEHA